MSRNVLPTGYPTEITRTIRDAPPLMREDPLVSTPPVLMTLEALRLYFPHIRGVADAISEILRLGGTSGWREVNSGLSVSTKVMDIIIQGGISSQTLDAAEENEVSDRVDVTFDQLESFFAVERGSSGMGVMRSLFAHAFSVLIPQGAYRLEHPSGSTDVIYKNHQNFRPHYQILPSDGDDTLRYHLSEACVTELIRQNMIRLESLSDELALKRFRQKAEDGAWKIHLREKRVVSRAELTVSYGIDQEDYFARADVMKACKSSLSLPQQRKLWTIMMNDYPGFFTPSGSMNSRMVTASLGIIPFLKEVV